MGGLIETMIATQLEAKWGAALQKLSESQWTIELPGRAPVDVILDLINAPAVVTLWLFDPEGGGFTVSRSFRIHDSAEVAGVLAAVESQINRRRAAAEENNSKQA